MQFIPQNRCVVNCDVGLLLALQPSAVRYRCWWCGHGGLYT